MIAKWPQKKVAPADPRFALVEGLVRQGGHDNFSTYCESVVTQCQLTVFKPEWQCWQLRAAAGSRGP